jgi:hypothetical protein
MILPCDKECTNAAFLSQKKIGATWRLVRAMELLLFGKQFRIACYCTIITAEDYSREMKLHDWKRIDGIRFSRLFNNL